MQRERKGRKDGHPPAVSGILGGILSGAQGEKRERTVCECMHVATRTSAAACALQDPEASTGGGRATRALRGSNGACTIGSSGQSVAGPTSRPRTRGLSSSIQKPVINGQTKWWCNLSKAAVSDRWRARASASSGGCQDLRGSENESNDGGRRIMGGDRDPSEEHTFHSLGDGMPFRGDSTTGHGSSAQGVLGCGAG